MTLPWTRDPLFNYFVLICFKLKNTLKWGFSIFSSSMSHMGVTQCHADVLRSVLKVVTGSDCCPRDTEQLYACV